MMRFLLNQRGDDIPITEGVVVQIAKNFDEEIMRLLLD